MAEVVTNIEIRGDFANPQYINQAPDMAGLSVWGLADDGSDNWYELSPSKYIVSPSVWTATGAQTLSVTTNGISFDPITVTKTANVMDPSLFSVLTDTSLVVNGTQSITGIETTMNDSDTELLTSGGVLRYLKEVGILPPPPPKYVGGIIFYIDDTADGTYTFYDANGDETSAPSVGDDCTGWTYEVTGASKDKYYVYNPNVITECNKYVYRRGSQTNPYIIWTYLDTTNRSYIDGRIYTSDLPAGKQEWEYYGYYGRVYETLDGTVTNTAIGTGKANTAAMLALRDGVYNQGSQIWHKGQTNIYAETIWYICDQFNKGIYSFNMNLVINNTGCDDWYIPSKDELTAMKNAIGAENFAKMVWGKTSSLPYSYIYATSSSANGISSCYSYLLWSWSSAGSSIQNLEKYICNLYDGAYTRYGYGIAFSRSF